jgi:hypothetical protein
VSDRAETVRATKSTELPSTWRVYVKEWVFDSRHATRSAALKWFDSVYRGRFEEQDFRYDEDLSRTRPYELWLRRWNLSGEFKHQQQAEAHAATRDDTEVVSRNSRREHELKAYGVAKLRV